MTTRPVLSLREPRRPPGGTPPIPPASSTADAPTDPGPDDGHQVEGGLRADIARAGPGATVVSLVGAVDMATTDVLASALAGAVSAGGAGGRIVLELNRVTFLSACGLGVIVAAHGDASRRDAAVVLVVDEVAPAATTLRFLPPGRGPRLHTTLTAALHGCGVPA